MKQFWGGKVKCQGHWNKQESPADAVKPATQKHAKIAPIRRVSIHFTEFHIPEFQITDA